MPTCNSAGGTENGSWGISTRWSVSRENSHVTFTPLVPDRIHPSRPRHCVCPLRRDPGSAGFCCGKRLPQARRHPRRFAWSWATQTEEITVLSFSQAFSLPAASGASLAGPAAGTQGKAGMQRPCYRKGFGHCIGLEIAAGGIHWADHCQRGRSRCPSLSLAQRLITSQSSSREHTHHGQSNSPGLTRTRPSPSVVHRECVFVLFQPRRIRMAAFGTADRCTAEPARNPLLQIHPDPLSISFRRGIDFVAAITRSLRGSCAGSCRYSWIGRSLAGSLPPVSRLRMTRRVIRARIDVDQRQRAQHRAAQETEYRHQVIALPSRVPPAE